MLQKRQGASLVMMMGLAVVLAAGALVYYQQNYASASAVYGGSQSTGSCPSNSYNQYCFSLTSRGFAQPFVVNSLNNSARFTKATIDLSNDGAGAAVVELRSYDSKKAPTTGTLLASSAQGTLTQAMSGKRQLVISAANGIALTNGSYVLLMSAEPYSSLPLKLVGASTRDLIAQFYDGNSWHAATNGQNYMVSHKFVIANAVAYDVFANDFYTISKKDNGHRAGVAFQSNKDGYFTTATIKLTNTNTLTSKSVPPKAKLVLASTALTGSVNLDKMKSVGDVVVTFNDQGNLVVTAKSKNGIKVAKNSIYVVILQTSDKDLSLSAPSTGAAVESTGNQPAMAFDNKDGIGSAAFQWIVSATHYFEITPVITVTVPSPTPTASASATPRPTPTPSSSPTNTR